MKAVPDMDVTLVFREGTPQAYRLNIVAARDELGNLTASMKDDDPNAQQYLNNNAELVLQQIHAAFKAAGHEVPDESAHILDYDSPIRKNDERLSPAFLTILVACIRTEGNNSDLAAVLSFARNIFHYAGIPIPDTSDLQPFSDEELKAGNAAVDSCDGHPLSAEEFAALSHKVQGTAANS